jgi:hypothetical protein
VRSEANLLAIRRYALLGVSLASLTIGSTAARAAEAQPTYSLNSYGEVGILETPTARMNPDGQIGVTISAMKNTQRFIASFQVLPWLEGTFRYSHLSKFGSTGNYFDRSFGMKMRFWHESEYIPEVSLGIRDLIGTGIYGSEYVVASKRIWDVDLSAGMGWGRLSDMGAFANPFGLVFQSFNTRKPFSGPGGQVNFGNFFHGPRVGIFGGAIWRTPLDGLDVLVEYSSDKYKREVATGNMKWKTPFNLGVAYRLGDSLSLTGGWLYGTTWLATLTLHIDPTKPIFPYRSGPPAPLPVIRTPQQQEAALDRVLNPDAITSAVLAANQLSTPKKAQLSLSQELNNETPDVHDFEVSGDTLLVDVTVPGNTPLDCDRYARVARETRPDLRTVAVTNLSDPNGQTTICATGTEVRQAQAVSFRFEDGSRSKPLQPIQAQLSNAPAPQPAPDMATIKQEIAKAAAGQSIAIQAMYIGGGEAVVYYENKGYFSEAEGAGRLARVLMALAPATVEVFKLTVTEHGIPLRQFTLARSALERAATVFGDSAELGEAIGLSHPELDHPILDRGQDGTYPRFSWAIFPQVRQSVFDPNAPYQVQFYASASGAVDIVPGLTASTKLDLNIWNNFDTNQVSTSLLPHVRSDVNEYFKHGSSGIENMLLTYRTRLAPDVFAEVKAGIQEDMFAGIGGQVLWRPDNSRVAFGIDVYHVWQRGFDRLFDLQKYNVTTGHVSMYYQTPWYGLNANLHIGRYLAGDYGATFELTRRFITGVEIGAYATFTNVPFAKFGEGSFDKGIIFKLPLEWGLPIHSTTTFDLTLRSLSRDGGARLANDDSLYGETVRTSYGEILEHSDDVTKP